jgi:hypothetical protein
MKRIILASILVFSGCKPFCEVISPDCLGAVDAYCNSCDSVNCGGSFLDLDGLEPYCLAFLKDPQAILEGRTCQEAENEIRPANCPAVGE